MDNLKMYKLQYLKRNVYKTILSVIFYDPLAVYGGVLLCRKTALGRNLMHSCMFRGLQPLTIAFTTQCERHMCRNKPFIELF